MLEQHYFDELESWIDIGFINNYYYSKIFDDKKTKLIFYMISSNINSNNSIWSDVRAITFPSEKTIDEYIEVVMNVLREEFYIYLDKIMPIINEKNRLDSLLITLESKNNKRKYI